MVVQLVAPWMVQLASGMRVDGAIVAELLAADAVQLCNGAIVSELLHWYGCAG